MLLFYKANQHNQEEYKLSCCYFINQNNTTKLVKLTISAANRAGGWEKDVSTLATPPPGHMSYFTTHSHHRRLRTACFHQPQPWASVVSLGSGPWSWASVMSLGHEPRFSNMPCCTQLTTSSWCVYMFANDDLAFISLRILALWCVFIDYYVFIIAFTNTS